MLRVVESSPCTQRVRHIFAASVEEKLFGVWSPSKLCLKRIKPQQCCLYHSWSFWNEVCLNWCLVEKLFRANTTSCVRSCVLPRVPVLEVCFQHTWFKLPHGVVKTRFRANTTRRVRAKRCPETFLVPANMFNMQTFLADFGTCCSAKTYVYFDWSRTWHFKAIALKYFANFKPRQV